MSQGSRHVNEQSATLKQPRRATSPMPLMGIPSSPGQNGRAEVTQSHEELLREVAYIRADHCDLRALNAQVQRMLEDEKKARQADLADLAERFREHQDTAEKGRQRLAEIVQLAQLRADEDRAILLEATQMSEKFEARITTALREEAAQREAELHRERQAREHACTELVDRWRDVLEDERRIRNKADEKNAMKLGRFEETLRANQKDIAQFRFDISAETDELSRLVADETTSWREKVSHILVALEESRTGLSAEVHERKSHTASLDRLSALEVTVQKLADGWEQKLSPIRQSLQELQLASEAEAVSRTDDVSLLKVLLGQETRAREQALSQERIARESSEAQLGISAQLLKLKEDDISLQRAIKTENVRVQETLQELQQSLERIREALRDESSARRTATERLANDVAQFRVDLAQETRSKVADDQRAAAERHKLNSTQAHLADDIKHEREARQSHQAQLLAQDSSLGQSCTREIVLCEARVLDMAIAEPGTDQSRLGAAAEQSAEVSTRARLEEKMVSTRARLEERLRPFCK